MSLEGLLFSERRQGLGKQESGREGKKEEVETGRGTGKETVVGM